MIDDFEFEAKVATLLGVDEDIGSGVTIDMGNDEVPYQVTLDGESVWLRGCDMIKFIRVLQKARKIHKTRMVG